MVSLSRQAQSLWAKKANNGDLFWLPLTMHMADSAAIATRLWNSWLSDGAKNTIALGTSNQDAEQLFVFLAALHDLGKATPVFQAKTSAYFQQEIDVLLSEKLNASGLQTRPYQEFPNASKTPHALATQLILEQNGCDRTIAVILGAHHGKPPSLNQIFQSGIGVYGENFYLNSDNRNAWEAVQKEIIDYALKLAGFSTINECPIPNLAAQVLLSGMVIMTDWIASNERYFPYMPIEHKPGETLSEARSREAWALLDLSDPWAAGNQWSDTELYKKRFGYTSNEIQVAVSQIAGEINEPGIVILEAPMGSGKTEAALVAAEIFADKAQRSGIFFALPTQATTDGIFPRIQDWINRLESDVIHSIRLVHGKAQFNELYEELKKLEGSTNIGLDEQESVFVHEWFEGKKKSLLADFVVGTIDQFLLSALKQKHVMLRHLGLANKIVILDECHAYDAYMNRYMDMALRWLGLYKVPVILLSATLPVQRRQALINAYLGKPNIQPMDNSSNDPLGRAKKHMNEAPVWDTNYSYPIMTYSDCGEIKQKFFSGYSPSVEVLLKPLPEEDLAELLENLLSDGGCAGIIVNTVKRSQEIAAKLKMIFGEERVNLLHSMFLAPDRRKKERALMEELGRPGSNTKRPRKQIYVGTQVFEQSLDIDFDLLIIDLCPMDLLLQRIGRLHRHLRQRPEKLNKAVCYIMGWDREGFEKGTEAVYGSYLLMRTKALLPQRLILPSDISVLVQNVYSEEFALPEEPAGYKEAKEKWNQLIRDKEVRAEQFRIGCPWLSSGENMAGWLDTDVSDKHGEAAVRDTDDSIEVLLIQEKEGMLCFLPWIENGKEIPQEDTLDNESARILSFQRVRLPHGLSTSWMIDRVIEQLEQQNIKKISEWQKSSWLKGELFLILDDNCFAELCGYHLKYDREYGLGWEKEETYEGKGI